MLNLIGSYECKLDPKGRFALPTSLKKQLGEGITSEFILKRSVFQKCLELHPISEWNSTMQKVNQLNRFVKKNNDFIRAFTAGIKLIEMDATGRVQIAKDLIQFAKLDKDIVVASSMNILEIWDKELYEQAVQTTEMDFASLTEEVMGTDHGNHVS